MDFYRDDDQHFDGSPVEKGRFLTKGVKLLSDLAMKVTKKEEFGGIDLNSANLNLQIKRDGKGVPLPLTQQDMAQLVNIQGFVPVILEIKPATTSTNSSI